MLCFFESEEVEEEEEEKKKRGKMRVGKYELGKTLGEGSFGKVKFARNVETGNPVAIKILNKNEVLRHKMVEHVYLFPLLDTDTPPFALLFNPQPFSSCLEIFIVVLHRIVLSILFLVLFYDGFLDGFVLLRSLRYERC